ncbi:hypothetical protein [Winogradskyella sp. UBA3174]|uniref:hypothetical protein n=1 Tax=Winogradskyella sp. UBA3174 TaxID=1947785 RepID=UPI0025F33122|nr:hypothetical protein [Winogradskyella sp. UBA3174]
MLKSKCFILYVVFFLCLGLSAQHKKLKGLLIATDDVEGIHVLNKSSIKYTVSNEDGSFVIPAKLSDTLTISSLKYKIKMVIITQSILDLGEFSVQLEEQINELNQVVVGKIYTGSLESDLQNSDAETEINFYDLGIPGFTGKPLTQNERKLFDADAGSMFSLGGGSYGAGGGVNFHKLLNKISGRTKKLKEIVALDNRAKCINRLRLEYESIIFEKDTLAENLKSEYFYFCEEDSDFKALCDANDDLTAIEFLRAKLVAYKKNRESVSKD